MDADRSIIGTRCLAVLALAVMVAGAVVGVGSSCRGDGTSPRHPVILVGIDGGEWRVIDWLRAQHRLPNFSRLVEDGISGPIHTFHHASPVIWTTVATGVAPEVHGIEEFVVATARGDQPVASTLRRVPALWNMASVSGLRTAVAGWWATWPAEDINGVIISDRAGHDIADRVSPAAFMEEYQDLVRRAREPNTTLGSASMIEADRVVLHAALEFATDDFDLIMVYTRGTDIASHFNWRYFEPEVFPPVDPAAISAGRERIAREYEIVDRFLGALMNQIDGTANLIVMSDHGFHAMPEETLRVLTKFDTVLESLGFLERDQNGVVFANSELYTFASPDRALAKKVRFSLAGREPDGSVHPNEWPAVRTRLRDALETVTWANGFPAFEIRDATDDERADGADFVVQVITDHASLPLEINGRQTREAVPSITRLSGTHGPKTAGIFLAIGPDFEPATEVSDMRVVDVPPTILYALGLPVAEDFVGRARTDLFTEQFRSRHVLRTIASWGKPREGSIRSSEVDDELIEQLRALGYID